MRSLVENLLFLILLVFSVLGVLFILQFIGLHYLMLAHLPHANPWFNVLAGFAAIMAPLTALGWILSHTKVYKNLTFVERRANNRTCFIAFSISCSPLIYRLFSLALGAI